MLWVKVMLFMTESRGKATLHTQTYLTQKYQWSEYVIVKGLYILCCQYK